MQNKPNLVRRRRIANSVCTRNYKKFIPLAGQKNKPNSNPIKANFKKAKMNVNSLITKDYRKKDDFAVQKNKPNSKPISSKAKMNESLFATKDYKNKITLRPRKNKPNQSQFQTGHQPPPASYLPPIFFKIYPKKCSCSSAKSLRSTRNFSETFNMHLFLFDNSIVLHTIQKGTFISRK
ncbi:MAG: hypothetical protein IIC00_17090 [Planctomycetes bacterium]|nr:hypothetical protein [Planctomycetota bacterium]